jgi:hypothetical protein
MLGSDDGSLLYLDDTLVVDNNGVNIGGKSVHDTGDFTHEHLLPWQTQLTTLPVVPTIYKARFRLS